MKLIGFVCALALAGAVGGCGDDEANGTGGTGGTGATGGTGGAGGATGGTGGAGIMDACTNADDTAAYEAVGTYTNADGDHTGTTAVAEIAADCVFGTAPNLTSDGCGAETTLVLMMNSPENRAALAACVIQCTIDQPVGLSPSCLSCYGNSVVCGAAFCAGPCAASTDSPGCIDCRCGNNDGMENCFENFEACSGLPPSDACTM